MNQLLWRLLPRSGRRSQSGGRSNWFQRAGRLGSRSNCQAATPSDIPKGLTQIIPKGNYVHVLVLNNADSEKGLKLSYHWPSVVSVTHSFVFLSPWKAFSQWAEASALASILNSDYLCNTFTHPGPHPARLRPHWPQLLGSGASLPSCLNWLKVGDMHITFGGLFRDIFIGPRCPRGPLCG